MKTRKRVCRRCKSFRPITQFRVKQFPGGVVGWTKICNLCETRAKVLTASAEKERWREYQRKWKRIRRKYGMLEP